MLRIVGPAEAPRAWRCRPRKPGMPGLWGLLEARTLWMPSLSGFVGPVRGPARLCGPVWGPASGPARFGAPHALACQACGPVSRPVRGPARLWGRHPKAGPLAGPKQAAGSACQGARGQKQALQGPASQSARGLQQPPTQDRLSIPRRAGPLPPQQLRTTWQTVPSRAASQARHPKAHGASDPEQAHRLGTPRQAHRLGMAFPHPNARVGSRQSSKRLQRGIPRRAWGQASPSSGSTKGISRRAWGPQPHPREASLGAVCVGSLQSSKRLQRGIPRRAWGPAKARVGSRQS